MACDAAYTPFSAPGVMSAVGSSGTHASCFIVTRGAAATRGRGAAGETKVEDAAAGAAFGAKAVPDRLTKAMSKMGDVERGGSGGRACGMGRELRVQTETEQLGGVRCGGDQ